MSSFARLVALSLQNQPSAGSFSAESYLRTGLALEFLGTGSAKPTKLRNVSSTALHFPGGTFLFDCGDGTLRQTHGSQTCPSKIDSIFITHLHGNHCCGLPGMTLAISEARKEKPKTFIYGPRGLSGMFGESIRRRSFVVKELTSGLTSSNSELITMKDGCFEIFNNVRFRVRAVPIRHSTFCVGYVIEELKSKPDSIDKRKLKEQYGVESGPLLHQLERGQIITTDDGVRVNPEDVATSMRLPRKIVILGDTYDAGPITELAMDADVLVHEATFLDEEKTIAARLSHSTAGMAGAFAKRIKAKNLVLSHFSPRTDYTNNDDERSAERSRRQARTTFGNENVFAAKDGWIFSVPYNIKSSN